MSVRVRFAPSPTGYLHIGGARTALYNYLFAKSQGGTFVLRVEDTDLERSKREHEVTQLEDLKWLGITHDEGPDCPGEFGPYRQSERGHLYQEHAAKLVEQGLAYYDFCTDDELDQMREKAMKEGKPPHYTGKWRNEEFYAEAANRLAGGDKAAIRFKAPRKAYVLQDEVRGRVVFPEGMVGDFVIMRSNGQPVYNFCCVVDDMLMKISHVIRGEDHLNNSVRQLMIYEAFEATPPVFAHASLLIGKDRQKLSKRHGATSVRLYKDESYLPQALVNYLSLLGWSHPDEKEIFSIGDISHLFDLTRFSKASAIYNLDKLKWVNGMHIRSLGSEELKVEVEKFLTPEHFYFSQSTSWQEGTLNLLKNQIEFFSEFEGKVDEFILSEKVEKTDKINEVLGWETTGQMKEFLLPILESKSEDFLSEQEFKEIFQQVKTQLGLKGKPLFMGLRVLLSGAGQGPELGELIPLIPIKTILTKIKGL